MLQIFEGWHETKVEKLKIGGTLPVSILTCNSYISGYHFLLYKKKTEQTENQ